MKPGTVALLAGLFLAFPAALGLFLTGVPTILCPFPTITVLPALFLSALRLEYAATAIPTLLFFAWNPSLLHGSETIPKRTAILTVVLSTLSVIYFALGWKWGISYQGSRHTVSVTMINVLFIATLLLVQALYRRRVPSFRFNLAVHFLLFLWLAWFAFPYLGELP